jgi:hypothetical protein
MTPPPRPRHLESCGRKRQFLTEAEALAALARWLGPRPPFLQVYQCTACDGWHWGNRCDPALVQALLVAWSQRHNANTTGAA